MSKPITPKEVASAKVVSFPAEVFDAFNELIVERGGTVMQDAVVKRIMAKMPDVTSAQIFAKGWLDIEDAYRQAGWKVTYDKPGFNETYEASWKFQAGHT